MTIKKTYTAYITQFVFYVIVITTDNFLEVKYKYKYTHAIIKLKDSQSVLIYYEIYEIMFSLSIKTLKKFKNQLPCEQFYF